MPRPKESANSSVDSGHAASANRKKQGSVNTSRTTMAPRAKAAPALP